MDDIRNSFSRFKKGVKHRLNRKKLAPDMVETNPTGGRADQLDSPLRQDHRATASGHDGEGSGIGADVSQVCSRDRSPQPEPIPASKGNDDPQRREADVDEKGAGQGHSRLDPDVEVVGGSGPNRGAHSFLPSPSLPQKVEPGST